MIDSIVAHLQANTSGFALIDNARDLQPQETKSADTPAMFLFRNSGTGSQSNGDLKVRQQRTVIVSVHLVCAAADLDSNEQKLFDAMLGFQIDANYRGFEYIKDEVISITGKVVWHEYQFITWHTIREL